MYTIFFWWSRIHLYGNSFLKFKRTHFTKDFLDTRRAIARRVSYIWVLYVQKFCVNIWCQYLMSIFDVNIWCQYLMSIFDVTIWSLKRNPCKSNIFSIYKRIPCKFNIGFLLLKTWDFFMIEQKKFDTPRFVLLDHEEKGILL